MSGAPPLPDGMHLLSAQPVTFISTQQQTDHFSGFLKGIDWGGGGGL